MGIYYKWVQRERCETINPTTLVENCKLPVWPRTTQALVQALMYGPWDGKPVHLINDTGDEYYEVPWKDISIQMWEESPKIDFRKEYTPL